MIPYGRQEITQADIDAVVNVLRSEYLTQGPVLPLFEEAIASYLGAKHALAVNSATSALHLACLALDLGVEDWLWTTPISFVASANCGLYCGARVDFVDIDSRTYNLCPKALELKLVEAQKYGRLPKVLVAVHLGGQPCDMASIHRLSQKYGFRIIEDASHAIGSKYKDEFIGTSRYSDITILSFHPVKIITTGEGGMLLTNNHKIADRAGLLRSHGITRDPAKMTHSSDGPWYYQQISLGFNYRMTDLQAALGISQMERLPTFITRRQELSARYDELLKDLPVKSPWQHPDTFSSRHLYVIRLNLESIHKTHRQVFEQLRDNGIGVNLHYIPIYTQPYYESMGFKKEDFPESEKYYAEAISLPMYYGLTDEQQDQVVDTLKKILTS
jgi:UDP-4-amino-4,6-dideoxy-N-acetyl-beta-L-altrosamine transaminase